MMEADLSANFFDILRIHATARPNHPAIDDGDQIVAYRALDELIDRGAANLHKKGVKTGDVVGLMLGDNATNLILSGAIGRAGAVLFSLGPGMTSEDIGVSLQEANASVFISENSLAEIGIACLLPDDILRDHGHSFPGTPPGGDHPLVLVQSSGTTGKPKMFQLTHSDLICRSVRQCQMVGLTQLERLSNLSHLGFFASRAHYWYSLRAGATAVIPKFSSVGECASFMRRKNVNNLRLVASHLFVLLGLTNEDELLFPGLRTLAVSSAPITAAQRQAARSKLSPNFVEQYATNETGVLAYADTVGQTTHPDGVGWIVDGVKAQIVDGTGAEKPPGETGLVRFKGQDFPSQYLNNEEATAKAFKDGWFYTGDVARISKDGYLFLLGRADDVINNTGVKFYPIEVENVLLSHPGVAEAAVVPWPHKLAGQIAAAAVVVKGNVTYEQLKEHCSKGLAGYKVPHVIAFRKALPKNAMGKVLKRQLAAQMQVQAQAQSENSYDG